MMWNVCRIDDLGDINRGKSKHRPRNDARLFGGKYPFIQTGDVKKANLYITEFDTTYSEFGLAQSRLWPKDTLCITIAANIAESAILGFDACFPDSVVGFVPKKNKADLKFVKYLLDEFKVYMQQISKGTTQDNLSLDKLRRVKFYAPDYDVQVKIAKVISAYDDLIENNNKRIKILEKMAENLYKEWFVRFRFPGYEQAEFENGIPKGWEIRKIKDCIKRLPYNRLYKASELKSEGKVIVIDQSTAEYLGYHDNEPSHSASYDFPIILFGDHSCKFKLMCSNFSLGENVIPFTVLHQEKYNMYFLYYAVHKLINTEEYKRHWNRLINMKILKPSQCLQNKFAEFIIFMQKQKQNLFIQNKNLIKQRDMLLPRLMSGKLEV